MMKPKEAARAVGRRRKRREGNPGHSSDSYFTELDWKRDLEPEAVVQGSMHVTNQIVDGRE